MSVLLVGVPLRRHPTTRKTAEGRGNTVATSTSFRIIQPVQAFALDRTIWTPPDTTSAPLARLRALSGACRVGVRVSLGALRSLFGSAVTENPRGNPEN